jgi:hypothetical protein
MAEGWGPYLLATSFYLTFPKNSGCSGSQMRHCNCARVSGETKVKRTVTGEVSVRGRFCGHHLALERSREFLSGVVEEGEGDIGPRMHLAFSREPG